MAIGTNKIYLATRDELLKNSDIVNTELASEVSGEDPEIDPVIQVKLTELENKIAALIDNTVSVTYDADTQTLNISSGGGIASSTVEQLITDYVETYDVSKIVLNAVELNLSQYAKASEVIGEKELKNEVLSQMDAAKTDIAQQVIDALGGIPVFGTVDDDNVITVTSTLADGVYTLMYTNAEGNLAEIGKITIGNEPAYTNVFDANTSSLNSRYSNSAGTFYDGTAAGYVTSNKIPINISDGEEHLLRVSGAKFSSDNNNTILFFNSANVLLSQTDSSIRGFGIQPKYGYANLYTDISDCEYVKIGYSNATRNDTSTERLDPELVDAAYIRVQLKISDSTIANDDISGIIMTIDEPIEVQV